MSTWRGIYEPSASHTGTPGEPEINGEPGKNGTVHLLSVKHIFLQDSCRAASVFHTIIQKIYALKLTESNEKAGDFQTS